MMKKAIKILAGSALLFPLWLPVANSASISLTPDIANVKIGDLFQLTVNASGDFPATFGGALGLNFDSSVISFQGWAGNTSVSVNHLPVDTEHSKLDLVIMEPTTGGAASLFSLEFMAIAEGTTSVRLYDNDQASNPLYGWLDPGSNQLQNFTGIAYQDATVTISAVPLPAAAWFMISGLIGIAGMVRNKSRT